MMWLAAVLGGVSICARSPILHDVQLTYESFPAEVILKRLLPAGVEVPASFETAGES
jgi:hypothetical protein